MKVLVLAGGADQLALISVLKERKCEVILVDYFENPPAKEKSDKHYVVSTLDIDKVLDIAIKENGSFDRSIQEIADSIKIILID